MRLRGIGPVTCLQGRKQERDRKGAIREQMEERRLSRPGFLLPMFIVFVICAIPSSSLRDPFVGLQLRAGLGSEMQCCNECTCVEKYCICMDRSMFGCFNNCGFCQCYDKPERTCYCVDVLPKCPPSCVLSPDAAAGN